MGAMFEGCQEGGEGNEVEKGCVKNIAVVGGFAGKQG